MWMCVWGERAYLRHCSAWVCSCCVILPFHVVTVVPIRSFADCSSLFFRVSNAILASNAAIFSLRLGIFSSLKTWIGRPIGS